MDKLELCKNLKLKKQDYELIQSIVDDDFDEDSFIDSLIGYEDILRSSQNSTEQYVKAVQFCSYIAMGLSQAEAYTKTFPDRVIKKKTASNIQSSGSIYANRKLTKQIMQRMFMHNNLLFMDKEFKARKKLFDIGMSGEGKVSVEALKVFLDNQYREREKNGIDLTVNIGDTGDSINSLNEALINLSQKQLDMNRDGLMDMKEIAESKIIDVKVD